MIEKILTPAPTNFVGAFYLDNTVVCDELISHFNNCSSQHQEGRINQRIDKALKDSTDLVLHTHDNTPAWQLYQYELNKVLDRYTEKFPRSIQCAPWGIKEVTNIQYYKPGAGYHSWHSERLSGNFPSALRNLVFMTYLNDVTDAGETEFDHQQIKIQPEKGLTLIWPADWTHYHRGIPSLTQPKYIITGWLSYLS